MSARPFLIKQRSSWLLLPLALHLSLALVDEHAKLTIEHPLPGVWRATTEVSLAVALGEEAKARMDELSVCYFGGVDSPICVALSKTGELLPGITVSEPSDASGYVSEVRAWIQHTNNNVGTTNVSDVEVVYMWQDAGAAAKTLSQRLRNLLMVTSDTTNLNAADTLLPHSFSQEDRGETRRRRERRIAVLRHHLQRVMNDNITEVVSVYGRYFRSVGFGTYGLENSRAHFWGSPTAGLKVGRFCSFATEVEFFLDGNHRLKAPSTYPFSNLGHNFGWPVDGDSDSTHFWHNTGKGQIEIGSDVWVGHKAVFLSGIKVGHGAAVGTRAVVTKDVPPYAVGCMIELFISHQHISSLAFENLT
jgi:acetyltransferase-like isoleucine patch superfamily enzyme